MGMGPVPAIGNALKKSGMKLQDMELIELNEAFASQSLRSYERTMCTTWCRKRMVQR